MLKNIFLLLILVCTIQAKSQLYFPSTNTWESITPQSLGWKTEQLEELKSFLISTDTKSFLILKDGKIVLEYYFGGHDATKPWYWASAGKTLTSMLVGFAEADKKIDLQSPSSQYLGKGWSSCTDAQENAIKVWNHLTMTTGLDDAVSFECTDKECLKFKAEPGSRWSYHNAPYTLLDGIIEGATGSTLNVYFKTKVGDPIGMKGLFVKSGYNNIFYSTTRDMARFGLFLLADGSWAGKQILNNPSYLQSFKKSSQNLNPSYGYLTWLNGQASYKIPGAQISFPGSLIPAAPATMYSALGKNEQRIHVLPEEKIVVIRMGETAGGNSENVSIKFDQLLWERLSKIMNLKTSINEYPKISKEKVAYYFKENIVIKKEIQVKKVEVFDLKGTQVLTSSTDQQIPATKLNPGIYLLKVYDQSNRVFVNKIFKY
jgi:CubicO group peptidase (beta-lactamase class C family)